MQNDQSPLKRSLLARAKKHAYIILLQLQILASNLLDLKTGPGLDLKL